MCLKVRTSFAANSEVALVVTGVDTVIMRAAAVTPYHNTHILSLKLQLHITLHPTAACVEAGVGCRRQCLHL